MYMPFGSIATNLNGLEFGFSSGPIFFYTMGRMMTSSLVELLQDAINRDYQICREFFIEMCEFVDN